MVYWDDLGFETAYTVDADIEYPGDGDWGMPVFGAHGDERDRPVAVIRPTMGDPWVLAARFDDYGALYGTPDPVTICVLDRYADPVFLDVTDPLRRTTFSFGAIRVASARDESLLLFADHHGVVAWGVDGLRWVSRDIALDEVKFVRTDNGRILTHVDAYAAVRPKEIVLDASTGKVIT